MITNSAPSTRRLPEDLRRRPRASLGSKVRGLGFRELARNIAKQWQWCYFTVLRRDYGSRLPNTSTALGLLLADGTCL